MAARTDGVWVKIAAGRYRLVYPDSAPPVRRRGRGSQGDPNHFDLKHGQKDSPIVEDLGLGTVEEGKVLWGKDYLVLPDGRHGPRKFRSHAEKVQYLHLTGHRERGSYTG